jgi:hypothetical protein
MPSAFELLRSVAMSRSADEPPLVPYVSARPGRPEERVLPIPIESRVTTVARVVGIVRDVLIILFMAAVIFLGFGIAGRIGQADVVSPGSVAPCDSPTTDQWGTFCPETPGG